VRKLAARTSRGPRRGPPGRRAGFGLVSIARHPTFRGLPAILELAVEDARPRRRRSGARGRAGRRGV